MGQRMIWKQTRSTITQVPLSDVIDELWEMVNLPPEKIAKELLEDKKLLCTPEAKYHIWRDSLRG
ncbi:MAG: hypothetical protein GY950_08285 [bacterium]|nr:hypothetical protein [bacterium]